MTDIAEQLYWRFCFCSRSAAEVKSLEAQVNRQEHALILANAGLKELHERNERLRKAIRDFLSGPHTDQSNRTAQRRADLWRALRAALEQGHD